MRKSGLIASILCAGLVLASCGQAATEPQTIPASSSVAPSSEVISSSEANVPSEAKSSEVSEAPPTESVSDPAPVASLPPSSAPDQEKLSDEEEVKRIIAEMEEEAKVLVDNGRQMTAYAELLKEHMTPQDYGSFNRIDYDIPHMIIYATNMEAVENAIAQCPNDKIKITCEKAKYSCAYLDHIKEEIEALPFVKKAPEKISHIGRVEDDKQYYITLVYTMGSFPELKKWVEDSPYSDIIIISEMDGSTKTNPA